MKPVTFDSIFAGLQKVQDRVDPQGLVNPVDSIKAWFTEKWPELCNITGLWLTGGQVWRRFYGLDPAAAKDVDIFTITEEQRAKVDKIVSALCPDEDEKTTGSMGPLGGTLYYTSRGRVDLWSAQSVGAALRAYSDSKAHVRMAISTTSWRLIVLPSEVKRKDGERYIITNPDGSVGWAVQ